MEAYYLGIDIGTYSSKGVLVNTSGEVIAQYSIQHELNVPQEGYAEHDAKHIWWGEFTQICKKLLVISGINCEQIKAVGHSAMAPCLLCADKNGEPLHPAILYGIDTRAHEQQQQIYEIIDKQQLFTLSGCLLSSQSVTPKMLWVKQHLPQVWKDTYYLFSASGYITYKLTGEYCLDCYDAIGYPGLYDCQKNQWSYSHQTLLGIDKLLPQLRWATEIAGYISEKASQETGLKKGTPVLVGCADAAAEALSAGVSGVGDTMIMYGSSTFFITRTAKETRSSIFWGNHFLEPNTYVVTGGTATCGSLLTWFLNQFGQQEKIISEKQGSNPYQLLMKYYEDSSPTANNLICLPYFSGERTPILDNKAKGVLLGLTLNHTLADIYRAVVEGIAMSITHNLTALSKECDINRLLAVGGGVNNHHLLQAVTDYSQKQQFVSHTSIGASYGNCIIAAVTLGQFKCLDEAVQQWVQLNKSYIPSDNDVKLNEHFDIFLELYHANRDLMHRLS